MQEFEIRLYTDTDQVMTVLEALADYAEGHRDNGDDELAEEAYKAYNKIKQAALPTLKKEGWF